MAGSPPALGSEEARRLALERVQAGAREALELAHWMYAHPELSLEERVTSERYRAYLGERGFEIEEAVAGMETAFVASWGRLEAPVTVALLAEMDALPGVGHACGHNLSGPASLLAASALAETLAPDQLRLMVVGCPAEETGFGKPALVEGGIFEPVDAAMMAHASDMRRAHRLFLGNRKLEFVYHGRAAHAAAYPERGINALDSAVGLYVGIGLMRQQLPDDVRVHAIFADGGLAPNIIPERAALNVWVRALDAEHLDDAVERVKACAQGAAEVSGARLEVDVLHGSSPAMRANLALAGLYRRQLEGLGYEETDHAPTQNIGSSDITHVSQVVPTIHPNFPIGTGLQLHTREFAEATTSAAAEEGLVEAARALALTVVDLATDPEAREAVRRDWERGAPSATIASD